MPEVEEEPIVWNINGQTIVYDPIHPERSNVHPVLSTGGQQFLLFSLGENDFTQEVAYKRMRAIADAPTVARQTGSQGVIFLQKNDKLPPVDEMTKKQRETYGVQRGVDGTLFVPSVKLKILGSKNVGDVRAYGYDVRSPTNKVLNVVIAVDEKSHKSSQRKK